MRFVLLIIAIISSTTAQAGNTGSEKILTVSIDEFGIIKVGRDTVSSEFLSRYIQERLFKSYIGTGHMYDKIRVEKMEQVADVVVETITKEIKDGQQKALTQLCVHRFRKKFEDLDTRKKDKLKKQFPVLFQENFHQSV
jgi:hypothetical protein